MTAVNGALPRTLHTVSALHAATCPDATAVLFEDRATSFAAMDRAARRIAAALLRDGVRRGDRVAYYGRDSDLYFEIALACALAGAVLVPVNWRLSPAEVDHILGDSGASFAFAEPEFLDALLCAAPSVPSLGRVVVLGAGDAPPSTPPGLSAAGFGAWIAGAPDHVPDPGTGTDDAVVQVYTSGTTGLPKGVVLAHRSFFAFIDGLRRTGLDWLDWLPGDVSLVSFPGSYVAGTAWFWHGFINAVPSVVMPMFDAEEAVRLVRRHKATITFAAPAMLHLMLAEPGADKDAFRSMRKVAYGAAPMPPELLERCFEVMDCQFAQVYASTETGSCATMLPPADHLTSDVQVLRSVGLPCPGNEVKIVDSAGQTLAPGEIGRVCIRTEGRMLGYWNLPEETAKTLVDGWLLMGDAGYLDPSGRLHLCDRINDMIIMAGQNIYPAELENALRRHPAVADCAVIGVADPQWGESVHAYVVLAPGEAVTPRELILHLRGTVADFKIPTGYEFIDELPRNPSGKVLRRVLRECHAQAADRGAGASS